MNAIRKIFCRCYQTVMRAAIPLLPYREPSLLGEVGEIAPLLKAKGISRVLLFAGNTVRGLGLTAPLEEHLRENGINYSIYSGTVPNPTSDNVEEALATYRENGCQALIAFGGGSAIDCAKVVGACAVCPKKPLRKMAGLIKIRKKLPLLLAIPTTAGTGSETTVASVIVDSKTHHKYVISDFCLIPHYALLDPNVTVSQPPQLTATTGMDALTHAVEAYIGRSKTRKSKAAAEQAVKLIFENLEKAYFNGSDLEARKNMLYASYLAGTAFTKSYVGYVHAIAHTLGGKYNIAHGLANAVLLPTVLRAYGRSAERSLGRLAKAVGLADEATENSVAAELFISRIEQMNERMGIPRTLDCVVSEDIPELAKLADKEANPLYPVPTLWNAKELEAIYRSVLFNLFKE